MKTVPLGSSALQVTPICLGTMTFGEQVNEAAAHSILDRSLERGVNFLDAAEMYSVPARAETCGSTETILGNWFAKTPGLRDKLVLATKVAGPSRGMPWIRGDNSGLTKAEIINACEGSLRRLQTDVIDLMQYHENIRMDDPDRFFAPKGPLEALLEASLLTTLRAAWLMDQGKPNNLESSIAKAKSGELSRRGAQMAVEVLGAMGITHDHLVEKWFRDARIGDIYEGTGEIQRLVIARALLHYSSADLM